MGKQKYIEDVSRYAFDAWKRIRALDVPDDPLEEAKKQFQDSPLTGVTNLANTISNTVDVLDGKEGNRPFVSDISKISEASKKGDFLSPNIHEPEFGTALDVIDATTKGKPAIWENIPQDIRDRLKDDKQVFRMPSGREVDPVTRKALGILLAPPTAFAMGIQVGGDKVKEGVDAIGKGDIAGGTFAIINGLTSSGFAAITPLVPVLAGFAIANKVAEDVGLGEEMNTVMSPFAQTFNNQIAQEIKRLKNEGRTPEEISEQLGVSLTAVKEDKSILGENVAELADLIYNLAIFGKVHKAGKNIKGKIEGKTIKDFSVDRKVLDSMNPKLQGKKQIDIRQETAEVLKEKIDVKTITETKAPDSKGVVGRIEKRTDKNGKEYYFDTETKKRASKVEYEKISEQAPEVTKEVPIEPIKEDVKVEVKKIKDFKTEEGKFSTYDLDVEHRGRPDMFTVLKDKDGYVVRNAFVPDEMLRQGIATDFYKKINEESLQKTGNPLRSSPARKLPSGEMRTEMTPDAIGLWDSFVEKGLAEKISDRNYKFKQPPKVETPKSEVKVVEEIETKKDLSDIRKEKFLEGKTENLDKLISEGWRPVAKDIKDQGAITKLENEIANLKKDAPIGNENHPDTIRLKELQQQLKEGITKKSYRLEKDDSIRDISKIEYDYLSKVKIGVPKVELEKPTGNATIDRLRKEATDELNNVSAGFNPQLFSKSIQIGAIHLKNGMVKFTDWSKQMVKDLGEKIKPQLLRIWNEVKKFGAELGKIAVDKIGEFVESKYNIARPLKATQGEFLGRDNPIVRELNKPTSEQKIITPQQGKERAVIDKFVDSIRSAGRTRKETERLYSQERKKRFAKLQEALQTSEGEAAYYRALKSQKGELPKADFDPIRDKFTQGEVGELFNAINKSPKLDGYEVLNAMTGLNKILTKTGGKIPTIGELKLLEKVFGGDLIKALLSKHTPWEKAKQLLLDVINIPRVIMTAIDMSMPLRQALVLTISKPRQSIPAFKDMHKYFFSEKAFLELERNIESRANKQLYEETGLYFGQHKGEALRLAEREEAFMSKLSGKIPILGIAVRAGERAALGYLNKMRADVFDSLIKGLEKQGYTPEKNIRVYKDLSHFINLATGRGKLGKAGEKIAPLLNSIFFSPRNVSAKISLLNPVTYVKLSKPVRIEAMKDMLILFGFNATLVSLAATMGLEVETDPRSADFMKIKFGDTRIDPWGGFQQPIRYLAQIITGKGKTSQGKIIDLTGEKFPFTNRIDVAVRFLESKLSPQASLLLTTIKGKDFLGRDVNWTQEAITRLSPMYMQDAYEAAEEQGTLATLMAIPAWYGAGLQTYKSKSKGFGLPEIKIPEYKLPELKLPEYKF